MKVKRELSVAEYITNSLFELMKVKPYSEISINDITDNAKVHRASFYRNFSSKEDIIEKWLNRVTVNFIESSKINFKEDSLNDFFLKLFNHLSNYKKECTLIYQAGYSHLLKNQFEDSFLKYNMPRYDDYKSYFMIGGIFNVFNYWIMNGCKETPKEITNKLVNLMSK